MKQSHPLRERAADVGRDLGEVGGQDRKIDLNPGRSENLPRTFPLAEGKRHAGCSSPGSKTRTIGTSLL